MINWKKLSSNSFFFTILLLIFHYGCNKEPETKKYIARVNDAYLFEEDITEFDSLFNQGFSRSELIKKWIDDELLFQEAAKLGLTEEEYFKRIMKNSYRELASSMLIKEYIIEKLSEPNELELIEYYEKHKNEFKAEADIFVFHKVSFSSESAAIKFRSKVIETGWKNQIEDYINDESLVDYEIQNILTKVEIYPIQLLYLVEGLNPGEVSIVLEEAADKYTLVQLMEIIKKGSTPPFEVIRENIKARFMAFKTEQIINEYIEELHSNNEIEIK